MTSSWATNSCTEMVLTRNRRKSFSNVSRMLVSSPSVTDGAVIYPEPISRIWSEAVYQVCLFNQSRLINRAAMKALNQLRQELPKPPPKPKSFTDRMSHGKERNMRMALVFNSFTITFRTGFFADLLNHLQTYFSYPRKR